MYDGEGRVRRREAGRCNIYGEVIGTSPEGVRVQQQQEEKGEGEEEKKEEDGDDDDDECR
ncbi:hypothetical protein IAQ61_005911 [Plenodomus lingam]|uniref:uncharacterized protein n=1 Tax=Leptosphaeria maculans TaxID=5022 RepID=UPI00332B774A|nr:hypothetical protein IAQ61_005911 [Plenodomus lingam]